MNSNSLSSKCNRFAVNLKRKREDITYKKTTVSLLDGCFVFYWKGFGSIVDESFEFMPFPKKCKIAYPTIPIIAAKPSTVTVNKAIL